MKVSELTGAILDYWVAKAGKNNAYIEQYSGEPYQCWLHKGFPLPDTQYDPSTDWSQGGPIIEREKITLYGDRDQEGWAAVIGEDFGQPDYCSSKYNRADGEGETALIAAMRCFVNSKFGETVDDSQAHPV